MKSGTFKRALGVLLVYIGVFVLLVLLQFSRPGGFSWKSERLSVSASYARGEAAIPESLRIAYAGLVLESSASRPLLVLGADGKAKPAPLSSVKKEGSGVLISYAGGIALRVLPASTDEGGFSLEASADSPGARGLRIPYSLVGNAALTPDGGALQLKTSGGPYVLQLSSKALVEGRIALEARGSGFRELVLLKASSPSEQGRFIAQAPKDEAVFRQGLQAWVDRAWQGLSASRYDPALIAWSDLDGKARFSEKALTAYLAEAFQRGASTEALARMKPARERYPSQLSQLSVPFLGDTIRRMQELEVKDAAEVRRLQSLVLAKDPSLFEKEDLVHWLMDRSPFSLAQDALRFAAEIDPGKISLRQAIGVLGCIVESRSYLKPEENPFAALGAVAERVVAATHKSDTGFFLQTDDDGSTDLRLSLLAGFGLIEHGKATGKDILVGVGQSLVEGVLGLADEKGFLPSRIVVRSGSLESREGSLAPEELYPLIAQNPYYPREVSFYRDVAPGVWAWTCAPKLSVEAGPSRYVFSADFPVGLSHFMAFYGIKPFTTIKLYGINYNQDAEFEIYNVSGFLYRRNTNALYLKMRHKAATERIDLDF